MPQAKWIAVDWGTTNFRAYLIDANTHILERIERPQGVLTVQDFPDTFKALLKSWLPLPVVMAGMVGSTRGWVDVPYFTCPVSLKDLARQLHRVQEQIFIVPGVMYNTPTHIDVMRGEETQVLGAEVNGLFCLPGTHSKWVTVADQTITTFTTYMTGELFKAISAHTILNTTVKQEEDESAFLQGVMQSQESGVLSSLLFRARSLVLTKHLASTAVYSFLSGLLIGSELKQALQNESQTVNIIAEPILAARYQSALHFLGKKSIVLDAERVTIMGLLKLATLAGVI